MILNPKIEKSPYRGRGDTPLPHPPLGSVASLPRLRYIIIFSVVFFTLIFMPDGGFDFRF